MAHRIIDKKPADAYLIKVGRKYTYQVFNNANNGVSVKVSLINDFDHYAIATMTNKQFKALTTNNLNNVFDALKKRIEEYGWVDDISEIMNVPVEDTQDDETDAEPIKADAPVVESETQEKSEEHPFDYTNDITRFDYLGEEIEEGDKAVFIHRGRFFKGVITCIDRKRCAIKSEKLDGYIFRYPETLIKLKED